jgi:hypothetical protein
MSDEMAAKVEEEQQKDKTEEQKAQEAKQARLWMVMMILDPETGEFFMQPNANVKKQWQLDALIATATKQTEVTAHSRVLADLFGKMIEAKQGKKLFGLK